VVLSLAAYQIGWSWLAIDIRWRYSKSCKDDWVSYRYHFTIRFTRAGGKKNMHDDTLTHVDRVGRSIDGAATSGSGLSGQSAESSFITSFKLTFSTSA